MTIMRLYNRNGHVADEQKPVYRYSDMLNDVFGNESVRNSYYTAPSANVSEESDAFIISLAVPGLKKADINMNIDKDILLISHRSENEESHKSYNRKEFDFRNFERSFRIPETINTSKIKAVYEEGILTITLPKREEAIDRGPLEIKIS